MQAEGRLGRRVALVTGGASGIGKACALALAREGAHVMVSDINHDGARQVIAEVVDFGGKGIAFETDSRNKEQIEDMVMHIDDRYDGIDILVNSAGGGTPGGLVHELTDEQWDITIELNLRTVFLCCRAVLPKMLFRHRGRIINIASIAGEITSIMTHSAYSTAKAGVIGFTRHLAKEVALHGITVNAVAPAVTQTPAVQKICDESPDIYDKVLRRAPMGRICTPEEIAAGVVFLASDEASYVTGITLDIQGGWPLPLL